MKQNKWTFEELTFEQRVEYENEILSGLYGFQMYENETDHQSVKEQKGEDSVKLKFSDIKKLTTSELKQHLNNDKTKQSIKDLIKSEISFREEDWIQLEDQKHDKVKAPAKTKNNSIDVKIKELMKIRDNVKLPAKERLIARNEIEKIQKSAVKDKLEVEDQTMHQVIKDLGVAPSITEEPTPTRKVTPYIETAPATYDAPILQAMDKAFSKLGEIHVKYDKEKCIKYLDNDLLLDLFKLFSNSDVVEFNSSILTDLFTSIEVDINIKGEFISYEKFKTIIKDNIDSNIYKLILKIIELIHQKVTRATLENYITTYTGLTNNQREVIRTKNLENIEVLEEYLGMLGLRVHTPTFNNIIDVEFTEESTGLQEAGSTSILGKEFKVYSIDGVQYIKALELSKHLGYKNQGAMYKLVDKVHKVKKFIKEVWCTYIFITLEGVNSILKRSKKAQEKKLEQAQVNNIKLDSFLPLLIDQLKTVMKNKWLYDDYPDPIKRMNEMDIIYNTTDLLHEYYYKKGGGYLQEYFDEEVLDVLEYKITAPLFLTGPGLVIRPKGERNILDYFIKYETALIEKYDEPVFWIEILEYEPGHEIDIIGELIAKIMAEVYDYI